jgi:bifunctional UDP-N-acetylglucosamine pyrophosphorylase/glucosamine-1-phosphate N-acetyltransferase
MTERDVAVVVLAAGKGTRMESDLPKVLHAVAGRPMVAHVLAAAAAAGPARTVLVVGPGMESVHGVAGDAAIVIQDPPLGTGHAVMQARAALEGFSGDILVLFGDTPLLTPDTLGRMLGALRDGRRAAVAVLGFRPADPGAYGRLVVDGRGSLEAVVEFRDASEDERGIGLCNGGVMAIDGDVLFDYLAEVRSDNAKGEYYLTDLVAVARSRGRNCAVVEGAEEEVLGVNTRAHLAHAEAVMQRRLRENAMAGGVTLVDPDSVYLAADTRLGRDVVVEPNVFFGPGVEVGPGARIRAFSHLEGARVAGGAEIGPYARLRPGADIGSRARIGNFVEVKAASVEDGAKVNHLAYIGDARVGAGANVGAGTITCNYDGKRKSRTDIGAGAFIGSNSSLVAPVTIGDGAIVGAGSAIGRDVPAGALAVTRAETVVKPGWAARFFGARASRTAPAERTGEASGKQGAGSEPSARKGRY